MPQLPPLFSSLRLPSSLSLGMVSLGLFLLPSCKPATGLPTSSKPPKSETSLSSPLSAENTPALPEQNPSFQAEKSLLRLNVTQQKPLYHTPWLQEDPQTLYGMAVLLENNLLLTTSEMVANAKFLSLLSADKTRSLPAKVVAVDYNANLALLAPKNEADNAFLETLTPVKIALQSPKKEEELSLWQLLDDGSAQATEGKVKSFAMAPSTAESSKFLLSEVKSIISECGNSFTLPAFQGNQLAGLLGIYDKKNQIAQFIDSSVIEKFVADATEGNYEGFAELEIEEAPTIDPVFREYLKLTPDMGGIYIKRARHCGNAYKGGLRPGDVILALDNYPISASGYVELPPYGKLDWSQIIRGQKKVGDILEVLVRRNGENKTLSFPLEKTVTQNAIEPYLYDQKVPYIIHGGFIFTELSLPYLTSFGNNWYSKAPAELVNILQVANEKQESASPDKTVLLSSCIPTPATLGYERLAYVVVKEVNGEKIRSLSALSQAFKHPQNGFHVIKLSKEPYTLYLSEEEAQKVNKVLKEQVVAEIERL